jgi:hypothetical protein
MELRVFTEPQQGATYDDLVTVAKEAEKLGFGAFFRSDHYLGMGTEGLPGPTDAWITLAGIARETSTIRLGTLMTSATFRLPGPLAIPEPMTTTSAVVVHPGSGATRRPGTRRDASYLGSSGAARRTDASISRAGTAGIAAG